MMALPALFAAFISLMFAAAQFVRVTLASSGKGNPQYEVQNQISGIIQSGAMNFLKVEYLYLVPFVIMMSIFFLVIEALHADNQPGYDAPGTHGWRMVICFITGAILSASAGWCGMLVATDCNVKTAHAAAGDPTANPPVLGGLNGALTIAFAGGAVMGFIVVGLGLGGLCVLFLIFTFSWEDDTTLLYASTTRVKNISNSLQYMAGFSFGASAIALFARVAGGIYTKAADVGADLVGKVEEDFPEDSFYNPATIADNVGDNVGDVAGMGADLFESYVGSIVAAATLAMTSHCVVGSSGLEQCVPDYRRVALPFWVSAVGIVASIIGFFSVSTNAKMSKEGEENNDENLQKSLLFALHKGVFLATFLAVGFSAGVVWLLFEGDNTPGYSSETGWKDYACIIIGLVTGIAIGEATEYFTSYSHDPTISITNAGRTGPATVIIQGLGIGMLSAVPPVIVVTIAVMSTAALSGVYGAALAAVGMLATLGVTLATDAYGPVADNAGGVAEMAHLEKSVRETTDALDALGNTTAATGKGFAVGSAVLTALAFMNAFSDKVQIEISKTILPSDCPGVGGAAPSGMYAGVTNVFCDTVIKKMLFKDFFSLTNPLVLSGVLIGAMLPFLFAALTMLSVGKAATGIILEVRAQCADTTLSQKSSVPGETRGQQLKRLVRESEKEGWIAHPDDKEFKPDTDKCVAICTQQSIKEMLLPGVLAVMTPIGLGLLVGARCLGGLLMGAIGSGFLLAVMMNNAGGAWDNAKKYVENEHPVIGGVRVEKGSDHHAAVVTGDTVGDPFKDTSGPALNILIKLMSVLSLTCGTIFRNDWETWVAGVVILVVEAILCAVLFYFVWQIDETNSKMDQLSVVPLAEVVQPQPVDDEDGGITTCMVEAETVAELDDENKPDRRSCGGDMTNGCDAEDSAPPNAPEESAAPNETIGSQ